MGPSRRELLLASGAALLLLQGGCKSGCGARRVPDGDGPPLFSAAQGRALDAALEQLLPGGPRLPGARAAGVAGYFDRTLRAPPFRDLARLIGRGLDELDRAAQRDAGRPFADLEHAAQERQLARFQRGQVDAASFSSGRFFAVLLGLALEGYLGAPAHGGNSEGVVWRAIGFDPHGPHGAAP